MSEVRDYAKECGVRCRQIRMAKGMSQQQLADKLHVTAAAISKWEKEGISDINNIMKLSDALGQDIAADQLDQEGAVGEVGKEILNQLIEHKGYVEIDELSRNFYGMKSDRICNEIFKLERIGTVIREQFTDFAGNNRDFVFITAKGVIAHKNIWMNGGDIYSGVRTIDGLLQNDETSIQDIFDRDVVTRFLLCDQDYRNGFRFDYLTYLHNNHYDPIVYHKECGRVFSFWEDVREALLCGESCYADIIRRMAQSATRSKLDEILEWEVNDISDENFEKIEQRKKEITGMDDNVIEAQQYLEKVMKELHIKNTASDEGIYTEEEKKELDDLDKGWLHNRIDILYEFQGNEEEYYKSLSSEKRGNITSWFSYDEVYKYIDENILPPTSEYEKQVEEMLKEAWKYNKSTLRYYYSFPEAWEENGLAQFVRDRVGIPAL